MHDMKCFRAALLAALFVVGCGDSPEVAARRKLVDQIDKARVQLANAGSILADPVYITKGGLTTPMLQTLLLKPGSDSYGQVGDKIAGEATADGKAYKATTPAGKELMIPASDVREVRSLEVDKNDPTVVKYPPYLGEVADDVAGLEQKDVKDAMAEGEEAEAGRIKRAEEILDAARQTLLAALDECSDAPPSVKADAQQLLGEIEMTRAGALMASATEARAALITLHTQARRRMDIARSQGITADYYIALSKAPRDKVESLRDKTRRRVVAETDRIQGIDGKTAALNAQIRQLAQANESLMAKSRKLRAESDLAGGRTRLTKLHEAHDEERKANANTAKADAARDLAANLAVDKALAMQAVAAAKAELGQLEKRLETMVAAKKQADADTEAASDQAERAAKAVYEVATKALKREIQARALEGRALEALGEAVTQLTAAAGSVGVELGAVEDAQRRQGELRSELLAAMGDKKHLALVVGSRASAYLLMAELRCDTLDGAAGAASLAGRIIALNKDLGIAQPEVVAKLLVLATVPGDLKDKAAEDYKKAEDDFSTVLSKHLRDRMGKDLQWMYQGQLASAYLGHYRLKGEPSVLADAKAAIAQATEGQTDSQNLAPMVRLKAIIDAAGAN